MNPGATLITQINANLVADPNFAQQIRSMHANQTPLLDMVAALGLSADMSGAVRGIVAGLSPDLVAAIRQATLDMLDSATLAMPVDCNVSQSDIDGGTPVTVTVVPENNEQMIVVRAQ